MPAFDVPLEPVALADQFVRLEPSGVVRQVRAVEQMANIGPVDFGSVSAGGNATDSSGNTEIEVTELEHNNNQIGQYRVNVLSPVEVEVRQTGQQDQRFTNANTVSNIEPTTPPNLAEVYVLNDEVPYFRVSNPRNYDLPRSLVAFNGFKYHLEPGEVSQPDSQPVSIPTDALKNTVQAGASTVARSGGGRR